MIPKTQVTIEKIKKQDYIKLKILYSQKKEKLNMKRQPVEWEKIFAKYISDKGFTSKIRSL